MLLPYDACSMPSPMVYAVNRLQCMFYTPDDVCTMPPPYEVSSIPFPTMYALFHAAPSQCMLALCSPLRDVFYALPKVAPLV